jgi:hypothetical protein
MSDLLFKSVLLPLQRLHLKLLGSSIQDAGGHCSEGVGPDDDGGEGWEGMEDEGEVGREGLKDLVEGCGDGGDGEEAGVGGWRGWWERDGG